MPEQYLFPPERLDTPAFTLRSFQSGDGLMLASAVRRSYSHLREFISWATPDYSDERGEADVRRFGGKYLLNEDFLLAIVPPNNAAGFTMLGATGFRLYGNPWHHGTADISMWLAVEAAGQGLGTAVLRAMIRWGFTAWHWTRLTWICEVRNTASRRVAEKAGMQHEGIFRQYAFSAGYHADALQFAIVRDDFVQAETVGNG